MSAPGLILASASPSRRKLLTDAGLVFEVEPSGVDEDEIKRSLLGERATPQAVAETLAELKAKRVSARHPQAMVIGADSTLACDGRQFDKPPTLAAARQQLVALGGRTHELACGIARESRPVQKCARAWHSAVCTKNCGLRPPCRRHQLAKPLLRVWVR